MKTISTTTTSLILALAMAGCPGNVASSNGDGGPSGGDGSTSGSQDLASAPRGTGNLSLISYSFVSGGVTFKTFSASAGFSGPGSAAPCNTTIVGMCKVSMCPPSSPPPDGGVPKAPDAGNISITGGTRAVTLTPQADGTYKTATDTTNVLWNGGETLSLAAVGNVIGAFNTTVVAPKAAQLTMPTAPAAGAMLMVNRSTDLVLKWTGGQGSNVQAFLISSVTGGPSVVIACSFPGASGTGTVTSAALMNLQTTNGSFSFYSENESMVAAGNYDVTTTALMLGTGSNGQLATYGAKYQ